MTSIADYNNERGTFSGIFSPPANLILQMVKSAINVTVIASEEPNHLVNNKTGEYSGCLGKLQRGEADVAGFPLLMPALDMVNITQVNRTGLDTGVYILAPYMSNVSTQVLNADLLEKMNIVSLEVWSNTLVAAIVFATLLCAVRRIYDLAWSIGLYRSLLKHVDDDPLYGQSLAYQVVTHLSQTETADYLRFRERFISYLMSIFAFLFVTLFLSLITTDQVTIKPFFVYDTYERILSNKSVQPIWVEYLNDYFFYRDAPAGSLQRQIWDQSVAINKEKKSYSPLIKLDPTGMLQLGERAKNKQIVVFLTNMFYEIFLSGMCVALPGVPGLFDLRFKVRKDTNLKSSYYVLPIARSSKAGPLLETITNRFLEQSLFSDPFISSELRDHIGRTVPNRAKYDQDFFECTAYEKFPSSEPKTVPLTLRNFRSLLFLCGGLFLVAAAILLFESKGKSRRTCKTAPLKWF